MAKKKPGRKPKERIRLKGRVPLKLRPSRGLSVRLAKSVSQMKLGPIVERPAPDGPDGTPMVRVRRNDVIALMGVLSSMAQVSVAGRGDDPLEGQTPQLRVSTKVYAWVHGSPDQRAAFPTYQELADTIGVSLRTFKRRLKEPKWSEIADMIRLHRPKHIEEQQSGEFLLEQRDAAWAETMEDPDSVEEE